MFQFPVIVAVVWLSLVGGVRPQPKCENYEQVETSRCTDLYDALQTALVGNEINLYNLRKMFFPSSAADPILLNVEYELKLGFALNVTNCSSQSCDAVSNDNRSNVHCNYGWTSTVFYTILHPVQVNRMQPQLAFLTMRYLERENGDDVQTSINWDGNDPFQTLTLYLTVPHLSFSPTCDQVDNSLEDITSLLKVYAKEQGNLTEWDTEEAGYTLSGEVLGDNWWKHMSTYRTRGRRLVVAVYAFAAVFLVLLCTALSLLLVMKYKKWRNNLEAKEQQRVYRVYRSILWPLTGVLVQCCIAIVMTEFVQLGSWHSRTTGGFIGWFKCGWLLSIGVIWLVFFAFLMCVEREMIQSDRILEPELGLFTGAFFVLNTGAFIALCKIYYARFASKCLKTSVPPRDTVQGSGLVQEGHEEGEHKNQEGVEETRKTLSRSEALRVVMFGILLLTWITSLSIILFNLAPIVILLLIFPFRVITFYTTIAAAFLVVTLTLIISENRRTSEGDIPEEHVASSSLFTLVLPLLAAFFVLIGGVVFFYVYGGLVSGAFDNPLLVGVVSLIPSVILSSPVVWIYKKKILPAIKPKKSQPQGSNEVHAEATTLGECGQAAAGSEADTKM